MHFPAITDKTGPVQPEGCASLDGLRTQALLTDSSRNSLTPVDSEEAPGTGGVQGDLGDLQGSSEQALGKSIMGGNRFLQQWLGITVVPTAEHPAVFWTRSDHPLGDSSTGEARCRRQHPRCWTQNSQGPHSRLNPRSSEVLVRLCRRLSGEEPTCQCRRCKRHGSDPWVGKIPWRREWQPTPVSLPGESRGQRGLVGYRPWGLKIVGHD